MILIIKMKKKGVWHEKTVALHNLGCKVNAYELEAIQQLLEDRGYEIVPLHRERMFTLSIRVP